MEDSNLNSKVSGSLLPAIILKESKTTVSMAKITKALVVACQGPTTILEVYGANAAKGDNFDNILKYFDDHLYGIN